MEHISYNLRKRFEQLHQSLPKHYNFDSYYKTEDGKRDFSYVQHRSIRENKKLWEAKREDLFVIDAPPPTLSGELHVGHLFCYSHMDFIARYQRLIGKTVFMPLGIDNNGEPTKKLLYGEGPAELTRELLYEEGPTGLDAMTKYMCLFNLLGLSYTHPDHNAVASTLKTSTMPLINEAMATELLSKGVFYTTRSSSAVDVVYKALEHTIPAARKIPDELLRAPRTIPVCQKNLDCIKELADSINWYPKKYLNDLHLWLQKGPHDWDITRLITKEGFCQDIYERAPYRLCTWYTSSLSHAIVVSLLQESVQQYHSDGEHDAPCYPEAHTHVRFLSKDIVTSWVYYSLLQTVLSGCKKRTKPWLDLVISGHCLTGDGDKISKSEHNAKVDPFELLEKHNPDCVRYWAAMAPLGEDTYLSENTLLEGSKLEKKIWHVSKWMVQRYDVLPQESTFTFTFKRLFCTLDIPSLQEYVYKEDFAKYFRCLDEYDYHTALVTLRDSFMLKFSGVELSDISRNKKRLEREGLCTIITTFALYIACFSPFMPFVCEKVFELTFGCSLHDCYDVLQLFRESVLRTSEEN